MQRPRHSDRSGGQRGWGLCVALLTVVGQGAPEAPLARRLAEVEAVLGRAPVITAPRQERPLRVLLVADTKDHGEGEHDYPWWQKRWTQLLSSDAEPRVAAETTWPCGRRG